MKKTILMGLALACATASFAQETKTTKQSGAYLRLGLGYAFAHAGELYPSSVTHTGASATYDLKKGSMGEGLSGVIAGGYKFNRNIALELGVGVGIAPKKLESTFTTSDPFSTETRVSKIGAKTPIYLMPAVVISTGNTLLEPYARVGLAVNVGGKLLQETDYTSTPVAGTPTKESYELTYKLRTGIGFQGALGLKYHINNRVGLWLEAAGISQNIYLKSGELTKATVDGENVLDTYTTSERKTNFEFKYTEVSGTASNEPSTASTVPFSFSNFGINLGVAFQF